MKGDIFKQVELLRQDDSIRRKFREYYEKGYKDWVILSAVYNCMMNWKAKELGLLQNMAISAEELESEKQRMLELRTVLKDTVYPASWFKTSDMDFHIDGNALYVLKTYGFELRRADYNPTIIEKFLRERMRHYEFDFPHQAIFGEPPGEWPDIK